MALFKSRRQKITSVAMMHLIYETIKSNSMTIVELLDRVGIVYREEEIFMITTIIGYELCRLSLYADNSKELVDSTLKQVYDYLYYEEKVNVSEFDERREIIKNRLTELFQHRHHKTSKQELVYHLFMEQIGVNESIIEEMYVYDFIAYAKIWNDNAVAINNAYMIDDSPLNNQKNDYIDFRF